MHHAHMPLMPLVLKVAERPLKVAEGPQINLRPTDTSKHAGFCVWTWLLGYCTHAVLMYIGSHIVGSTVK